MKPVKFDYQRARSMAEAIQGLSGGTAKLMAGGQSLGPMLNLRIAQPQTLIDVTTIPELLRVEESSLEVTLGACVTTANIEDEKVPLSGLAMLPSVARGIAYRAVRNRGTIGGSVCHADPAADWLSTLSALGARCIVAGRQGKRSVPVESFVQSAFEVELAHGELLEAVCIPKASVDARWGYYKVCRKVGEFATAIGAVLIDRPRSVFRLVIGATAGRPIVFQDATMVLINKAAGWSPSNIDVGTIDAALAERGIVESYDRQIYLVAVQRAFARAEAR
jgi:aerobic carbon-monoxide dehydrogenase medium subunit